MYLKFACTKDGDTMSNKRKLFVVAGNNRCVAYWSVSLTGGDAIKARDRQSSVGERLFRRSLSLKEMKICLGWQGQKNGGGNKWG